MSAYSIFFLYLLGLAVVSLQLTLVRQALAVNVRAIFVFGILIFLSGYSVSAKSAVDNAKPVALQQVKIQNLLKKIKKSYSVNPLSDESPLYATMAANNTAELDKSAQYTDVDDYGIPTGEELLLELLVEDLSLADIFAFKTERNAQLGLTGFVDLLDFAILVNLEEGRAEGWFIKESNQFSLTWPENVATSHANLVINGQSSVIAASALRLEADDLYIDADLLSQWFQIGMDFNFSDLTLRLKPKTPLPVQLRWARKQRKNPNKVSTSPVAVLPWIPSEYQAYSTPLVDLQAYSGIQKSSQYAGYSVLGSQDLAYFNAEYFLSGNTNDPVTDLRLKLTKESPDGDLLGPLQATQYQLGDIAPINAGIGNTGGQSRGIRVSNYAIGRVVDHNKININGDIQPGWDIELYRNGLFIDSLVSLENGRYEFNDIELLYGDNQFEMISYGPQGQIETQTKQVFVDSNALSANESDYGFSVVEIGKSIFGLSDSTPDDQQGWTASGRYQHGITDWFSFGLGYSNYQAKEGRDAQSYSLSSNFNLFDNLLLDASYQIDPESREESLLSMRTAIGDQALSFRYNWSKVNQLDTDTDTETDVSESESRRYTLALSGQVLAASDLSFNYSNSWDHSEIVGGHARDYITQQFSTRLYGTLLNNNLTWGVFSNPEADNTLSGRLLLHRSIGSVFTRFTANYSLQPDIEFTKFNTQLYVPLTPYLLSDLSLDYFPTTGKYATELSLTWKQEAFSLNSNFNYDSDGYWSVGLNARLSFGYLPETNSFILSRNALANKGTIVVRVFEDANLNGIFDDGEQVIEDAKVKGVQSYRQARTDETGIAVLSSLTNNITTDIVLDRDSFSDPFLLPAMPGVSITPRAGYVETLDFPVVQASELEGTIYLRNDQGQETVASYVTINLFDDNDNLVASTETEYDGYYLFTDLLPGEYTAKIDPAYVKRKNLHAPDDMLLSFGSGGDVVNGADFTLKQLSFTKGYVVQLGEFISLDVLKTYWELMNSYGLIDTNQQAFYMENKQTKKFALNIAFYKTIARARFNCNSLKEKGLSCDVEAFEFEIKE